MKNLLLVMGAAVVLCSGCYPKPGWPPDGQLKDIKSATYIHVYLNEQQMGPTGTQTRVIVATGSGRFTLVDEKNEPVVFDGEVSLLNYFAPLGWRYVRDFTSKSGRYSPTSIIYLLEKK